MSAAEWITFTFWILLTQSKYNTYTYSTCIQQQNLKFFLLMSSELYRITFLQHSQNSFVHLNVSHPHSSFCSMFVHKLSVFDVRWAQLGFQGVSPFRRERQSLFTGLITLNPLSQPAVVAGMVRRASKRSRTSGHRWRSILFPVGQVFSKVPLAGSDSIMHMQTIIFKCNFSFKR